MTAVKSSDVTAKQSSNRRCAITLVSRFARKHIEY
jgi:hypothetical protein